MTKCHTCGTPLNNDPLKKGEDGNHEKKKNSNVLEITRNTETIRKTTTLKIQSEKIPTKAHKNLVIPFVYSGVSFLIKKLKDLVGKEDSDDNDA